MTHLLLTITTMINTMTNTQISFNVHCDLNSKEGFTTNGLDLLQSFLKFTVMEYRLAEYTMRIR